MDKPKISILISAYNAEKYLAECIQSVLNQNYDSYELIIVNDGSTDGTLDICKNYEETNSHVRVFSWENKGLILARRKGIELSRGEYILFLDADDCYEKDAFNNINMLLEDNPDVVVFRFNFWHGEEDYKPSKILETEIYTSLKDKQLFFEKFIGNYEYNHLWSKVIKRELLIKDNFDYEKLKDIRLGEYLLKSIQIYALAKKIIVSDKVIYNYRVLEQSMSHGFNEKQVEDITKVYMILKQYLQNVEWDTENCLEIANLEYTIKMSSLLRDLWDSNLDMKYKKNTSSKIVNINNGMINSTTIIIQNRILWELCKKKCWILSLIYCRLLKVLSKRRRSSSENRLFEKKNSV